jgi:hypothetical protein
VSGQNDRIQVKEAKDNRKQEGGVSVLHSMIVTAAVFHLERSVLNAQAPWNAVKGGVGAVFPIQNKIVKTLKKRNGWR